MNWQVILAFAVFITALFERIDKILLEETKKKMFDWFIGVGNRPDFSSYIYDSIVKLFSNYRFFKSCFISVISYLLIIKSTGFQSDETYTLVYNLAFVFLSLVITDYISLNQTLFVLSLLRNKVNSLTLSFYFLIDLILTFLLSYINIQIIHSSEFVSIAMNSYIVIVIILMSSTKEAIDPLTNIIVGIFIFILTIVALSLFIILFQKEWIKELVIYDIISFYENNCKGDRCLVYGALFSTTFFTSFWLYLYIASIWLTKGLFQISRFSKWIDRFTYFRKRPIVLIGLIASIGIIISFGIADFFF